MLEKDHDLKRSQGAKKAFTDIKQALCEAPILGSPYYGKEFQLFPFTSESSMVVVLLQKNEQGFEQLVLFMSQAFQGYELSYNLMEKQAYALIKALKYFRDYFWNAKIVAYVPHPLVKDILVQQACNGVRGRWITKIQELDLEIKPTKLVHGQGLAKLMAESSFDTMERASTKDI